MKGKIFKIINSCNRYEQLMTCIEWIAIIDVPENDRLAFLGAIEMRTMQLQNIGFAKITGDNRFPVDDEHQEKH